MIYYSSRRIVVWRFWYPQRVVPNRVFYNLFSCPGQEVETTTEAADAQRDQDATTTETDGSEVLKDPEFDNNKK